MSNIINLQRDQRWVNLEDPEASGGFTASTFIDTSWSFGGAATVFDGVGSVQRGPDAVALGADQVRCIGVRMLEPVPGDRVPYRLIGACDTDLEVAWYVGHVNGSGRLINQQAVGHGPNADVCVNVLGVESGSSNFGLSVGFVCAVHSEAAGYAQCSMSVQRMIASPPQYSSAVS